MKDRAELIESFLDDRTTANRDAVIAAHEYLLKRAARKFRRADNEVADLEQVAAVGLIKATDSYERQRTTPFEAYAWLLIVGELMHYVRDHERSIRVPRWLRSLERRYATAWEQIAAEQHAEPTATQLAAALEVGIDVIHQLQAIRRGNRQNEIDDDSPRATLQCDALPAKTPGMLSLEERLTVIIAIDELPRRERTIVLGTFAAGLSQAQIAATLGLSQSQVSKILNRALVKLQRLVA